MYVIHVHRSICQQYDILILCESHGDPQWPNFKSN